MPVIDYVFERAWTAVLIAPALFFSWAWLLNRFLTWRHGPDWWR
jgi:hypothetical protein